MYHVTDKFPISERYGLVSQMRRAAVSIPSNIAEGFQRGSVKEKIQFLRIAHGSGAELGTQLEIAKELGYTDAVNFTDMICSLNEIMKMITKAISVLGHANVLE